jgi:hypothetical protein
MNTMWRAMVLVAGVSLALSACDEKGPSPNPNAPTPNVEGNLVLTPGQTRAVEGMAPPISITFADVQPRNTCNGSACLAIFIPAVILEITGDSPTPVRLKLALRSTLATDFVPSVTTVGRIRIELTALDFVFLGASEYRATLRVTSS